MNKLSFTKMHGLGNDFMVVNALENPFNLSAAQIQQLANRRLGVGFDQLLVLETAQEADVDFHFRIFNADGHEVAQCGNGARCIARFIEQQGLSKAKQLTVSTLVDRLQLTLETDGQVSVNMGIPRFLPKEIPFVAEELNNNYAIELEQQTITLSVVNVGNPHAIVTVAELIAEEHMSLAAKLCQHPRFPEGINVGFMQVTDPQHIRLRVYERGVGETLACGSNACAAVVVGRRNGLLQEKVMVQQPGGSLVVCWQGPGASVEMTGPAQTVFTGVVSF